MNNEIQKIQKNELSREEKELILKVVATGDLKDLTPAQKIDYILSTCKAQRLDPRQAANYYEIIPFQKKEVLYAKKGLAEALRDARDIKCTVLSSHLDKENNLYSVKARAELPNHRSEESLAVLTVEIEEIDGWTKTQDGRSIPKKTGKMIPARGQELANLMMKCETKAKRRATLALCGLGIEERNFESERGYDIQDIKLETAQYGTQTESDEVDDWNKDLEVPQVAEIKEEKLSISQKNEFRKIAREKGIITTPHIDNWCIKHIGCAFNDISTVVFDELIEKLSKVETEIK